MWAELSLRAHALDLEGLGMHGSREFEMFEGKIFNPWSAYLFT